MSNAQDRDRRDADSHLMPDAELPSRHADPQHREALLIGGVANGGKAFALLTRLGG